MKSTFVGIDTPLKNALPVVQSLYGGFNNTTQWQTEKFSHEGVRVSDALYILFSVWSEAYPTATLKVYDPKDQSRELVDHSANTVIKTPNPDMEWPDLQEVNITYKLLSGNTYLHKRRDRSGRVREFMPYSDANITPVPRGTRWIDHYIWKNRDGGEVIIPTNDIVTLPWLQRDPSYPWKGLGPILPTARQTDTDQEFTKLILSLAYNGAYPGMIVGLSGEEAIDADIDEIASYIASGATGENRGKTLALKGNVTSTKVQSAINEIAIALPRQITETRLAAAFRVPAILAGFLVGLQSTRYAANTGPLLLQFYLGSVCPMLQRDARRLTKSMQNEFPDEEPFEYRYDFTNVDALRERTAQEQQQALAAYTEGVLQIDEARQSFPVPNDPPDQKKLKQQPTKIVVTPPDEKKVKTNGAAMRAAVVPDEEEETVYANT